jgi:hypothetical protein
MVLAMGVLLRPASVVGYFSPRMRLGLCLGLVALVLVFAGLLPYLNGSGSCGDRGCPQLSAGQPHVHAEPLSGVLLAGAIVAVAAPPIVGALRRPSSSERRPAQLYLSPDPEPPRL